MSTYRYRAVAISRTNGRKMYDRMKELSSADLHLQQGEVGALAFHRLINRWNKNDNSQIIYLYTVEEHP